jgi:hypothetical protein
MRFLLILIAVFVFVLLIRTLLARPTATTRSKPSNGETIVPCRYCGLHIPKSEAVFSEPGYFCSAAHQHQWLQKQNPGQ